MILEEEPYFPVPLVVFEKVFPWISAQELRIILVILRMTFGMGIKQGPISLCEFKKYTMMDGFAIHVAIHSLLRREWINAYGYPLNAPADENEFYQFDIVGLKICGLKNKA